MSKPLILELKEKVEELENNSLNLEIIQENFPVPENGVVNYSPNYKNIKGEIVASFLIGGISTNNNEAMELTPTIEGIGTQYTKVKTVVCKSTKSATLYVTIGVFTKKKIN